MQLTLINNKLKPLAIAGILASSSLMYADLDRYSDVGFFISNPESENYLKIIDNSDDNRVILKSRYESLYKNWLNKTMFCSSANAIIEQKDFKEIVAIGEPIVPYIIETIEREPSVLVWALNIIYKTKISNSPDITIKDACKLWVKMMRS